MADSPPESRSTAGASSAGFSTASPYAAPDTGPGFDPGQAPPMQESPGEAEARGELHAEQWELEQVNNWLGNAGDLAHAAFGVGERDWQMTQRDLERIGEPLTRILNRYEPTRAVAAYSDPAAVAMGFGLYGWRSSLERIHALKAEEEAAAHAGAGLAPGFEPPPPSQTPPASAVNGQPPAPTPAPGPGQPGHLPPVESPDGSPEPSFADRLRATRPPGAEQ